MTAFQGAATFAVSGSLSAPLFSRQTAVAFFNPAGNLVGRSFFDSLFTDSSRIAFSNNFLTVTAAATGLASTSARSNAFNSSAYPRLYCSATVNLVSGSMALGVCNVNQANTTGLAASANAVGYFQDGTVKLNSVTLATIQTYATADVISMAVDFANNKIWFRKGSNNWNNNPAADPSTNSGGLDISGLNPGPYYVAVEVDTIGDQITLDFLGFDPATIAWVNAVVAAGGTVSAAEKNYVDVLINGLKSDGLFTKLDRLFLFASESTLQALIDIISLGQGIANFAPTFTANLGYTGNGSSTTIDPGVALTAAGLKYTQNSACAFGWAASGVADAGGLFGTSTTAYVSLHPDSAGTAKWTLNEGSTYETVANTSDYGLFLVNRTASNSSTLDLNGVQIGSGVLASTALVNEGILGLYANGLFTSRTSACLGFGSGLTAADRTNLYSRLSTYMASVFTESWAVKVVTNGGTVSVDRKALVSALIKGLITDGVWYKLDRLWLFAGENAGSALTDIVAGTLATANGSPAFVADRGYTGVDASSTVYIDTGYSQGSFINYSQNNAHISSWQTGNVQSSASGGTTLGFRSGYAEIFPFYSDGNAYFRINDASGGNAITSSAGHFIANRTGAALSQGYVNGALFATINAASSANTLNHLFALAGNVGGGGSGAGSANQLAMISAGGGLSVTDVLNFYNRLRTYMTAVGVP